MKISRKGFFQKLGLGIAGLHILPQVKAEANGLSCGARPIMDRIANKAMPYEQFLTDSTIPPVSNVWVLKNIFKWSDDEIIENIKQQRNRK